MKSEFDLAADLTVGKMKKSKIHLWVISFKLTCPTWLITQCKLIGLKLKTCFVLLLLGVGGYSYGCHAILLYSYVKTLFLIL